MANPLIIDCAGLASGNGAVGVGAIIDTDVVASVFEETIGLQAIGSAVINALGCEYAASAGTINPPAGDRAVYDAQHYQARHANDIDVAGGVHHTLASLASSYQPLATILTTLSGLANAAGALTNDGAGALSWAAASSSTGGSISTISETQIANGLSTEYYLANYADPGTVAVYINGIRQPVTDDTTPSDIVTFTTAPALGAVLMFDYELEVV